MESLKLRLERAAVRQDRRLRQPRAASGLAIIFGRIDTACANIANGADVATELRSQFNDRLLDAMLKAAGVPLVEPDYSDKDSCAEICGR